MLLRYLKVSCGNAFSEDLSLRSEACFYICFRFFIILEMCGEHICVRFFIAVFVNFWYFGFFYGIIYSVLLKGVTISDEM